MPKALLATAHLALLDPLRRSGSSVRAAAVDGAVGAYADLIRADLGGAVTFVREWTLANAWLSNIAEGTHY